ncbi:MarR family transcriptional regulator [Phenylobacterium sp. J426]|uniref:MarR family winged helix-turn-helix transcriptional regulator n=1 Tax=Phenylobacterium sp. J426 TaxID=2898439 RepID=UPI0021507D47|nr:MarR family transcriptional regulator [Phenylobacterium sp. J426]MCR5873862.1 MarR family transcriptional regulator [Phenylobacterium sp. J426]
MTRILSEILRPHDLSLTQWRLLYTLSKLKNRTMNEVADFLTLDRTSLTRAVDKLVARGLLLRTEVAHDRRLTEITLTAAGRALREEVLEQNIELYERLIGGVDAAALESASEVMELMLERLVGHRAGPAASSRSTSAPEVPSSGRLSSGRA